MNSEPTVFMRTKSKIQRLSRSGFTLIEIVTAIFIFSIVIGLVMGSFQGVFSNADHINATSDLLESGNACLNRMIKDLQEIHVMLYPRYRPPDMDAEPDVYRIVGMETESVRTGIPLLRFTSLSHLSFSQSPTEGIAQIVYYLQEGDQGDLVLRRSDTLFPYPEEFETNEVDPILCERLRRLEFTFFPLNGEPRPDWDSESEACDYNTPQSIGITLAIGDKEAPLVLSTVVTLPMYRFKETSP